MIIPSSPELEPAEQQLLADYEAGELRSVATPALLSQLQEAAKATGQKDQRINIRLSSADLQALRTRGIRHLLAEPGDQLAQALLGGGFVDRLIIFRTSVPLGPDALAGVGNLLPPAEGGAGWSVLTQQELGVDHMTIYRNVAPR